jgi:lysyl-tRNA synthetase class 2
MFRTRAGEVTLRADGLELLAKSLRPLPFGKEQRVDGQHGALLGVPRPGAALPAALRGPRRCTPEIRQAFVGRARMVTAVRSFLDGLGYLEVETPVLQPLYGGAAARPFTTHHNALDMPLYLRIADELYLKRLIVGGFERVYEIGHDFRNEGIDRTHNPEFTMLEFYEAYADYTVMMHRVERLLAAAADALRTVPSLRERVPALAPPFPRVEWLGALNAGFGGDVLGLDDVGLREAATRLGVEKVSTLSRPKLLDEMFQALVERKIDRPTFVVDYPVELSPLAKPKRGNPALTERFELFAQRARAGQRVQRAQRPHRPAAALRGAGAPEGGRATTRPWTSTRTTCGRWSTACRPPAGVGIGIDRLFMYLTDTAHIRDAILFPLMRPE